MHRHRTAYILLFTCTLIWAGNAIAGKLAIGHVSPMLLTALRWLFALLVLIVIGRRQLREDWPLIRPNLAFLLALGAIGFCIFNVALYSAVQFTSAINVAIEQAAIPMIIILGNFLIFRLRVSAGQIAGFLLSAAGVALTASHGDLTTLAALEVNLGDGIMLLGCLAYAAFTIAVRFKPDIQWQSLMTVMCTGALLAALPFAAWEASTDRVVPPDAAGWAIIAFTALLPSILSQIFFIRGTELIGGNRAGLFINLVPIFATLLAVALLGESFFPYHAVALALVFGGIWLAERGGIRAARSQTPVEK